MFSGLLFSALLFAAFLAVSFGAVLLCTQPRRDDDTLAARLQGLYRPEDQQSSTLVSMAENAVGAANMLQQALRHDAFNGFRKLLVQSQCNLSLPAFLARSLVLGAVLAVPALLLAPAALPVSLAVFAAGAMLPWLWLRLRRNKRMRKFQEALPGAAELMSRALRAGHSVQQALELVGTETNGPLADEFRQLHQEQKFGVPLREALRALAARIPSRDLQFLVTAIVVQKETGGDLIEILDRTTHVIRDRLRVQREVRTYTAQGRLTGWILSALPVVLLTLTAIITPTYSSVMFHDPTGQMLLAAAAALIVTGSLIIRKVVQVEV